MKNEKAFKISPASDFGKRYTAAKEQRQTFRTLAKYFANKHFGVEKMSYVQSQTLYCDIETPGQVCKHKVQGFWKYRKDSEMQKAWTEEVVSKINFDTLDWLLFWHWDYIDKGSYSLWDYDGTIYGYIEDTTKEPNVPKGSEEIKMSEYYRIIEEVEAKQNG